MSAEKTNNIFHTLYATRIIVRRNGESIINLSLLFCLIALLCASWLVIGGAIAALALGYEFSFVRNAPGFSKSFDEVVQDAKCNVKNAVDAVTSKNDAQN